MHAEAYRQQLQKLLPQGSAFPRDGDTWIKDFLDGAAEELARIDQRSKDLIEESDPRTAQELFSEWLRNYALPDGCSAFAIDAVDERLQLIQKITQQAGQTPDFYTSLAEALGNSVDSVQEFDAFVADGSSAEDPLYGEQWVYAFSVVLDEPTYIARADALLAGDFVSYYESNLLFCILQGAKPAHTVAFVGFK